MFISMPFSNSQENKDKLSLISFPILSSTKLLEKTSECFKSH